MNLTEISANWTPEERLKVIAALLDPNIHSRGQLNPLALWDLIRAIATMRPEYLESIREPDISFYFPLNGSRSK